MNFISCYFVSKILGRWSTLSKETGNNGFFYFRSPMAHGNKKIDRIGKGLIYFEDEIIPASWQELKGNELMSIYEQIKNNRLYFYKEISNRNHRINLK